MSSNITSSAQLMATYPIGSIVEQSWIPEYGDVEILGYSEKKNSFGLPLLKVRWVKSGTILDGFYSRYLTRPASGGAGASEGAGAPGGAGASEGAGARDYTPRNLEALQILGLNATATNANIKDKHRALVLEHHPDKGGNEETFKSIRSAYEHLRKGGSRRRNHRRRQRSKTRRSRR